jgi:RND superfamily putative drug exporter
MGISSVGGPTFGKLSGVSDNNQVNFLPASADSTKVQKLQSKYIKADTIPAIIVIESTNSNSLSSLQQYFGLHGELATTKGVSTDYGAVIGPIPSKDGKAIEYIVQIPTTADINSVVKDIRTNLNKNLPEGINVYVAGPAGLTADLINAFGGIDGILLFVAVGAVFIILLLVYRSIVLPFLVLLTAIFALSAAILFVYILASHGVIKLNGQSQGILSILVIGASTDYSLLIIARYREALERHESKYTAFVEAIKYSIEPITASAITVILALLCLLFSDLNSNRSLGPIAALGIFFSYLSAVTLLSSFLLIFGRGAFWPFKPKLKDRSAIHKVKPDKITGLEDSKGIWRAIPLFVSRKYRQIWIVIIIVLAICGLGLTQLKASGVSNTATILGSSNAVSGLDAIARHFPAGSGSPIQIIADESNASEVLNLLNQTSNINSASVYSVNNQPVVIDGKVLINATLVSSADSVEAQQTISQLRSQLVKINSNILVGGESAIILDTNNTAKADLRKIIPIVLIVILIILIFLLRSILSPVILIFSVIISFVATLGVSALVFNHIFHFPGSDPSVPLFGFIFLVALGVDYNIFLMSRVREESRKIGTRPGILKGLSVTGGVITSAGVVLAATFAALAIIPILFLVQIAFIVAFGVLFDTVIVRTLLVPALSYDIGKSIWWPSKLWKKAKK